MNVTLFGYPKTGKTTLFNLLTGARIDLTAYEDGKKEPHLRTCHLPDPRLDRVAALYPEKRKVPASLDVIDLHGISYGEVKNSTFLNFLRKADGLVHVVRGFRDPGIPHARDKVSPRDDILFMEEELLLADLLMVDGRIEKLEKDLKKLKDAEGEKERDLLKRLRPALEEGKGIRAVPLTPAEEKTIRSFSFLSQKPLLHMVNIDEQDATNSDNLAGLYQLETDSRSLLGFCGKVEGEIMELPEEEKKLFFEEYGLCGSSAEKFFSGIPALMDTMTFITVGKEEVRAWMIRKRTPAVKAAGEIHTDIEKGFIRAEVIPWGILLEHASLHLPKEAGAIRLEGKEYIVQDGDVIYFRFAQ